MTGPIRVLELRSVRGTGGGPEKTILLGTARTDPCRYAITVCYLRDDRDEIFHVDQRADQLPIDYVEVRERHSLDPGIWRPLGELIRSRRIDIVHAHDYKTDLLALLLARVHPIVPLSTAHGWAGHSRRERWLYYPADRRLLAFFPRVIAVSNDIRDALIQSGSRPDRVVVVPNGIDHVRFRRDPAREAEARRAFGLSPDDLVVGAVGRLEPEKHYPLLLRSYAELARRNPRLRLVIAGEGSRRSELEELAADLGVAHGFRLLGHVPDVVLLHHSLDLFVLCSDNEGSPNAVLEAMALETPVVCTDVGGVSGLVRDGVEALLVPRRDQAALTGAILRILDEPHKARERAVAARARVERELSFERRMQRVEGIYAELMAAYPRAREGGGRWSRSGHA